MSSVTTSARVAMSALLVSLLVVGCGGDSPDKMLASAKDYLAIYWVRPCSTVVTGLRPRLSCAKRWH